MVFSEWCFEGWNNTNNNYGIEKSTRVWLDKQNSRHNPLLQSSGNTTFWNSPLWNFHVSVHGRKGKSFCFVSGFTLDMFLISKFLLHRFANTTYFVQHRYSMLPNCFPTDTLKKVYMLCCQNSTFIIASFVALKKMMKHFKISPKKYINALIEIT